MLLPVRLHQLGEEGCQILVLVLLLLLVLLHAGGAGRGVEVHYFSGTESLKFQIVKHDLDSVLSEVRVEMLLSPLSSPLLLVLRSRAASLSLQVILDANGVLAVKHV